jgi:hypothetical protein
MAKPRMTKLEKDIWNWSQALKHEWENPPKAFNPLYDPIKQEAHQRKEKMIKSKLDDYHRTLKRVPNDEYYDLMDAYEEQLRK